MSRVDIAIGFVAIIATVVVTALVGLGEEARMSRAARGWEVRKVEGGAQLYSQYCAYCHGVNAAGGLCPPLDETSGLQGGDLGPGVAWRLEELGWDRNEAYDYVYGAIATGRIISMRPERYPGNRVPPTPVPPGAPAPVETSKPAMAMPPWGQDYGGPLRADQIEELTRYIVAFREALPDNSEAAVATGQAYRYAGGSMMPLSTPTPAAPTAAVGEATAAAAAAAGTAGTPATGTAGTPVTGTAAAAAESGATTEVAAAGETTLPDVAGDALHGAELFESQTCVVCHALPGVSEAAVCPNLAGIAARAAERVGQADYTGRADSVVGYITESLREPTAYAVEGYVPNLMPQFGPSRLSDQDILDLIAFLFQTGG